MKKFLLLLFFLAPNLMGQGLPPNPTSGGPIPGTTYSTPSLIGGIPFSNQVGVTCASSITLPFAVGFSITDFFLNLNCNVSTSTITPTSPVVGAEIVLTITQAGGGNTFAFPSVFVASSVPSLPSAAGASSVSTWQYCGTVGNGNACPANQWQNTDLGPTGISCSGCATNIITKYNGTALIGSSITDNGTTVSTAEAVNTTSSASTGASPCVGLTPGTGGVNCGNEGTTPTVFPASTDSWWQNSTAHCEDEFANGVELGCALVQPAGVVGVQTITGADYTNTTTTPSTVFTWTLPATTVAKNYRYTCDILWESTAATLVGPVFGLNISAAPTQLTGNAAVQNTLAGADVNGYLSNNTTGSQTLVTSGAAGVTTTNYWAKIWGTIEGAAVAGSTFIINAASTSGVTASLNIRRGAGCDLKLIQ